MGHIEHVITGDTALWKVSETSTMGIAYSWVPPSNGHEKMLQQTLLITVIYNQDFLLHYPTLFFSLTKTFLQCLWNNKIKKTQDTIQMTGNSAHKRNKWQQETD